MGLFWGLVILLFIETIEEAKGGVYIKRFRQRRALLANATSEDPIVFNHVYNIRMPDCESCSADVSAPSIFEASDDPKEHKYEHNIQGRNQVVFTHRINIPPQACGCSNDKDIEVLLSRLEALESQVSTLRDQCSNTGCCDGALAGKRQTDIRILCNGHGTFDSTKCNCDCEKGWTGPTCSDPECPSNCNKHGKCINGRCVCDTGFTGADCSETECPDDCNDQGRCIDGKCVCFVGYSGPRCDIKICPDNCNNRGRCVEGSCICNTGFSGPSCNVSVCPDNCSNKGRCINGKCVCYSGFSGPACNFKTCPNNCNNNGRCINGKCVCHTGFAGPSCSTKVCPNNCNNNGRCVNGKCECNVGFIGPSCGTRTCPDNCNNNGRCVDGKCECNVGFSGPSCGTRTCPDNCNNNGRCVDGKCECNIGFSGPSCGTRTCPDNCNNNGRCVDGRCECNVGFTGPSCASRTCPDNCNNNGHCVDGRCECNVGFTGPSCASRTCPNNCNNNGRCIDGKCECIIGFTGPSCATRNCPHNCNNNGRCVDGKCECNVGYTGPICATRTCPDNCNKNGRCVDGKCECNVGFTGPSCANKTCPGNCNNRGRCENGKCFCETGFSGEDCSTQCPKKCSSKGSCINGVCICFPGYTGSDCSKQSCPRNCNNRGRCINGQCICIKGFVGSDCSMKACPNDCSNRGKCLNGTCLCEEGFSGHDCSKGIPTVENLQVRNIQDTSVMLEWTKPRIAVDGYKISFRPMDNDEGFISIRVNETVRRFTQTGLQPGKEYTVTVQAEKNQKYGPASTKSIVTLIDSVQNLRVTGVSNNSISLKWDKSAADVERYIISYVSPTGKKGHLEVSSEADTAVLRHLEPGVRYLITVVAEMGSEQSKPARTNASTEKKKKTKEVGNGKMKASQEGLHTQTLTVPSTTISTKKFPPISDHGISQKLYPVAINKANIISKTTSVPKTSFVDLNTKATSDKSIPGSHRDDNAVPDNSDSQVPRRKVNNKPLVKDTTSNTLTVHSVAEKPTKATLMLNEKSVISPAGIGSLPKMIAKTPVKSKKPKGNLLQPPSAAYPSTKTVLVMTTLTPQEPVSPLISIVLDSDKNELGSMKPGQTTTNVHSKHSSTSLPVEHNSTSAKNNNSSVDPKDVPLKLNLEPPASDQRKNFNKIFQSILNRAPSMNKAQIVRLQIYLLNLTSTLKNNEIKKDAKDLLDYLYDLSSTKVSERVSPDTVASRTLQSTVLPEITIRSVNKMPQGNTFPQLPVEHVPLQPVNILEHATVFKGSLSITSTVAPHQNENSKFTSFYRTHMEGYDPSLTVTKKTKLYTTTQNPSAITKKVDPVVSRATATSVMLFFDNLKKQYDRFYVIIRSLPELTVVSKMNLPGNSSSVNITALNPGTTYKAYLYGIKKDRTTDMFILLVSTALKDDDDGDQMTGQDDHSVVQMTTPASQPKTDDPSGTNEGGGGIPGSIPSVLGTLSATDTSPHSLRLLWTVKSGSFTNYLIRYRDPVTGNSENIHLAGDVHTFLLTGLIPNKQYEIQLHGVANGQLMPPLITKATTVPLKDHSKPTNMGSLTVKDVTNNSFSLTWKALKGAFDSFIVQYEESEGPSPQAQEITIPGNLRTAIIRGLKPGTEYNVHVYGVRGNQRTQPLTAVTITEKALERPVLDSLSVSDVTENSMRLTWTVKKGILDSLIIQYRDSQNETHRETISGDLLTTVISGLKPSQEYVFNVTGISGGRSTGTQLARGKTVPLKDHSKPTNMGSLTVKGVTNNSFSLTWKALKGAFDSFIVQYEESEGPSPQAQEISIPGNLRTAIIRGLKPDTEYKVHIYGVRGNQRTQPLTAVTITEKALERPVLDSLSLSDVTENSMRLTWTVKKGILDSLIIQYRDSQNETQKTTISGDLLTTVISGLKPSQEYVFNVTGNSGGRSAGTQLARGKTVPLKDHSKPTNMGSLTVKGVTNNSFSLTWKALKGEFDSFIVQYEESEGPSPQPQEISIPGNLRTAIIRGLKPDTEYKVHVYGVRGNQRTQPLTAVTITEKALERPVLDSLSVSDVTENSMRLTWTVKKGILDSLIIQYRDSQNETHRETISGDLLTTVISGLKPSQEYVFNMTGISGGRSTGTQLARGKTASSGIAHERVEKFGHLSISDVTEDSFSVRWVAQDGAFDSFIVLYRDSAGISASQQKKVPGNLRTTVIKGLQPSTKYNVTLYGVHRGKRSVPQKAAAITTPSSPKGLTFTDIQDTSVTVNWLLPAENVDRIKVSYTTVPDGEPQNIIVEGKRNKGVLTGLTPASKYEVSVISMRGFDESEPLSGVVMTLPDSPSNLRAVNVTETTALLHWRPALAPVDNYMVTYNTKNAPEATRTTSGNTVEVQLSDLKHNTEYTVKVYSVKEANRSRPAVTVFTTAADAIKDLWVTEVSPHSAVLSWNAPKVPVSGYVLSYETATGKRKTVNVISSPTSYNLTDLHPGTKYNVHLQAVRGGNRMPSVDASFTTVLDSPSNLRAVNVSDTTALLHWTPALAAVDNYVVTYNAKNAPEVIRSVSGNTAELQLSGLKVSTEYSVKVHSAKGTNESQPAFTVFTTAADAPKDLKASAVSPRGAVISWKPPKAPVSSYMLSYETAAGESKGVNVNASATVYKLTGLYPATKYNIHLHAVRGGSRMAPINTSFTTVRVRYPFPKDCSQEMLNGLTESGLTTVYMNGDRTKPFQVYCDMETDGGGWLVLQRRMNGKTDFWRGWKEYAEGFGDPREEFWLGNEKIHNLTKQNRYKLRIDLRAQAESAYAEYDDFRIDNATKYYKLHLGKYSGNAGDSFSYHSESFFATKDRNPVKSLIPCPVSYRGAWWYKNCHFVNLNGHYGNNKDHQGINWHSWKGFEYSIPFAEMKMRPYGFEPLRSE